MFGDNPNLYTHKKMNDIMIDRLIQYCKDVIEKHPELRGEVQGIFDLCMMELEDDCASVDHEVELAFGELDELINDKLKSARG